MAKKPARKKRKTAAKAAAPRKQVKKVAEAVEEIDLSVGAAAARIGRTRKARRFSWLAELADEPPLLVGSLVVAALGFARRDERQARAGARMLIALGLAVGAVKLCKRLVSRTRPRRLAETGEYDMHLGKPPGHEGMSFPSGHSAAAVAVARAVARDYPAIQAPSVGAAVSAAGLKVLKGDHFPTDILVGAGIGYLAEMAAARIVPPADWREETP
jgi:membrane-associated phospholipid phosphatase